VPGRCGSSARLTVGHRFAGILTVLLSYQGRPVRARRRAALCASPARAVSPAATPAVDSRAA